MLLLELDRKASAFLYAGSHGIFRTVLILFEHSGSGTLWVPITLACWLSPLPIPSPIRSAILNLFLGFILDLAIVGTLKSTIKRHRPVYNKGMNVIFSADRWSFPSGHASRAFLIVFFICFAFPNFKPYLFSQRFHSLFMFATVLWGISTAVSRVFLGRHYLSDVFVGSIIGYFEALLSFQLFWLLNSTSEDLRKILFTCLRFDSTCTLNSFKSIFNLSF